MDYQTLLLFHSAKISGHKGPVTRIVSGCDKKKEAYLKSLYQKLYPQYHVHFTPDFSIDPATGERYVFYNKPHGLKHWLEFADPPVGKEVLVNLVDPDMIFLRPMTGQVRGADNLQGIPQQDMFDRVTRGRPVAAVYGLGAPWAIEGGKYFRKREICDPGSACLNTTQEFGAHHYSVGPPYVVHRDDMYRIASSWVRFAPKVYAQYPELLAEMYAYSIAAAHEQLPHLQLAGYMISNIHMNDEDEAWPLIDQLEDVCAPPVDEIFHPGKPLPFVMHHCQNYRAGNMGWAKRRPELLTIFSCEAGLLLEPPADLGQLDWKLVDGKVSYHT
jgi:hypothetical protein